MTRSTFYYFDAAGNEIDKSSKFDGKHYVFYDLNVIISLRNHQILQDKSKVKDLLDLIRKLEFSWVQYDTALLEGYSNGFAKPIDCCKEKMVNAAFEINSYIAREDVNTFVTDKSEMVDYLDLYKSSRHFNYIFLALIVVAQILIRNREKDQSASENVREFVGWYRENIGFKLAILVRLVIKIFYTWKSDSGIRSLIKKKGENIEKSLRSSSCDLWHLYHFIYRSRYMENFESDKAIFITDDAELSNLLSSVNLMGILGQDDQDRIIFDNIFDGINITEDDKSFLIDWMCHDFAGQVIHSRVEVGRMVSRELDILNWRYSISKLPWQTH